METWAPRPPCPRALVLQGPSADMRGCMCPAHMPAPAPAPSPSHVGAVLWGLLGGGGSREGDRGWAEPGLHEGGRAHLDRPARPACLQIDRYAQRDLKKGLHLYGTPGNVGLTNAWSIIQTDFRCCGVANYTDWFEVYNATRVPDSCCLEFSESCGLHAPGTWWKAVSPRPSPPAPPLPPRPGMGRGPAP